MDSVIVTLLFQGRQFDVELPAKAPVGELCSSLASGFQARGFTGVRSPRIFFQGQQLAETVTLLQSGIWDGSYLEIRDD